jgi:hypothetical protein
MCERRHPSDTFLDAFSHLPSMVRKASGVCAPRFVGDINSPPSPGQPPPMCYLCMSGWSVISDSMEQGKSVNALRKARQGILNSACARLSRAVPPFDKSLLDV